MKRIYAHTDRVAARHPGIEFIKVAYLNDHAAVLDAFSERVEETLQGANLMNCKLCKYREQILGFEAEKGLPQESHHHHVEGIGTGFGVDHGHAHAHGHHHGHHHDHVRHDHDHPHGHGEHREGAGDAYGRNHSGHEHRQTHPYGHGHGRAHGHGHHPYPHADHPLGPRTLKRSAG